MGRLGGDDVCDAAHASFHCHVSKPNVVCAAATRTTQQRVSSLYAEQRCGVSARDRRTGEQLHFSERRLSGRRRRRRAAARQALRRKLRHQAVATTSGYERRSRCGCRKSRRLCRRAGALAVVVGVRTFQRGRCRRRYLRARLHGCLSFICMGPQRPKRDVPPAALPRLAQQAAGLSPSRPSGRCTPRRRLQARRRHRPQPPRRRLGRLRAPCRASRTAGWPGGQGLATAAPAPRPARGSAAKQQVLTLCGATVNCAAHRVDERAQHAARVRLRHAQLQRLLHKQFHGGRQRARAQEGQAVWF